jgi:hypothetical protein
LKAFQTSTGEVNNVLIKGYLQSRNNIYKVDCRATRNPNKVNVRSQGVSILW